MSSFRVDAERVMESSRAVEASAGAVADEVQTMMSNLRGLQDSWQGQAAEGFQSVVDEWHGVQEQVRESLQGIREALAVAGRQYAEVEDANSRMFRF
ncbi:WXG100 family type VII secretion target [Sediminivirga luteola]|uniref:ESAT-6-like protein n=1 Tax=Sediminivirga luteola TaxID=1774748 RepID=A0A8J2XJQ5_9MICO|nr:WXG100 family type VII secretion target [Sediminivirga luteola]MCI2265958.1 WXG100 family type VII secretion target [Sediminivirga luteola]GGA03546.1 ESAT-6-like protein [Sediminivirga luteola]